MSEQLARFFHETYERLAPQLGDETRKESAVPWEQVPEKNRILMIATCSEVEKKLRHINEELVVKVLEVAQLHNDTDKGGTVYMPNEEDWGEIVGIAREQAKLR